MKIGSFLLIFLLHLYFIMQGQADSTSTFQLKFLRAKFTDPEHKKNIVVVFQLLPKNPEDFPPMFEPELTYSLDGGREKTINVTEREVLVNLEIFGTDINVKDTSLYGFVKDQLIQNNTDYLILAFSIENISKKGFEKMTFTYGLREKNNTSIRRVQKFEFTVEK